MDSASMTMVFVLFCMMMCQVTVVESYLNLYISKEDLKNDLFLDIGNDIYILSDGKPAPLLSNPNAFKNLIAPLPPSIAKIKFHWDANPTGDFSNSFEKKIKYSLQLSSSDTEVMARPKASIAYSDTFYLPRRMPKFNVEFPCSGKKDGLVDLGFHFNYSINSSDISHKVTIMVRRHCYKIEVKDIPTLNLRKNITRARKLSINNDVFSNNTALGIILGGSALILSIVIIFILRFIQQRNKRLHMKFDIDYELKMKEREQEDLLNTYTYEIDLKTEEKVLVKREKSERHSKPIYIPATKKHRKWKLGRRKHHSSCKSNNLCYSTPSLENIIEEEDDQNNYFQDNPVILNLNLSSSGETLKSDENDAGSNEIPIDSQSSLLKDQYKSVKGSKSNVQNFFTNNHVNRVTVKNLEGNDASVTKFKMLNDEWSIQYSKYILYPSQMLVDDRFIMKDSLAQIHRGKIKGLDKTQPSKVTPICVKVMNHSTNIDTIRAFMYEAYLMKKFSHENIMELLGVMLRPTDAPFICSPHMRHSDLNQLLRNSRATPRHHQTLSTRQLINFGVQISNGMKYLARHGYVHSALCARHIMVNSAFTIKIAGLGYARDSRKQKMNILNLDVSHFVRWFSVETIKENIFNEKTDIWSFGIIIWELMTFGKQPYPGLTDAEVKSYLLDYHRLHSPPNCPDIIAQIMYSCWQQLPKERPSFAELFERLTAYEDKYKKYVAEYVPPPTKIIS